MMTLIAADYHIQISTQQILQFVGAAERNWRFAELQSRRMDSKSCGESERFISH